MLSPLLLDREVKARMSQAEGRAAAHRMARVVRRVVATAAPARTDAPGVRPAGSRAGRSTAARPVGTPSRPDRDAA